MICCKVSPEAGSITLRHDAHIPAPALGDPNTFSGSVSAKKVRRSGSGGGFFGLNKGVSHGIKKPKKKKETAKAKEKPVTKEVFYHYLVFGSA